MYRTLVETAPEGVTQTDLQGNITYVSPRTLEIHGFERAEELLGRDAFELIAAEEHERAAASLQETLEEGRVTEMEYCLLRKDGGRFAAELSAALIRDADGRPRALMAITRDISERKAAERTLRESEERMRLTVQNVPALVDAFDDEGRIVVWNRECERVTGYGREEIIGNARALELLYPDEAYRESVLASVREEGGDFRDLEFTLTAKDGSQRIVSWSNLSGRYPVPGWATWAVGVDVTKRKAAEVSLRRSRASLAKAQEIAHLGSWELDLIRDELVWSEEVYRIFGLQPQDFGGTEQAFFACIHPEDRKAVRDAVGRALPDPQVPYSVEHRVVRPDGTERVVHERGEVVRDGDGNPVRMLGTVHDITERKQAEQTLEAILAASPAGIGLARGRKIVWCNQAMARITGYPAEFLLGEDAAVFYADEAESERVSRELYARLREGGTAASDIRVRTRDDRIIDCHLQASALGPGDPSQGIIGVLTDVTERRRAERALQESERRYREIFNSSSVGLWEMDFSRVKEYVEELAEKAKAGVCEHVRSHPECTQELASRIRLLDANDTTLEMFGVGSRAELLAGLELLLTADSRESFVRCVERYMSGNTAYRSEQVNHTATGDTIHVQLTATIMPGSEDTWERVLITVIDMTERKKLEETLQHQRDFAESLIETAQTIVLLLDTEGRIVRFNPYLEELSGYRLGEVRGRDWFSTFLPERDRDWVRAVFFAAIGDVRTRGSVNPIVTKDGREREIEWCDKTLRDSKGRITGLLSVGRDITEQKAAAAALRRKEAQLAHAGRLSAMGEMAAGIAHEVSQPLYSILNFAKASGNVLGVEGEPNLAELREWNAEIAAAAARAGGILSRLRGFARSTDMQRARSDINEIVREAVRLVGCQAESRKAKLELELYETCAPVEVDRIQIQQVLVNLLQNAYGALAGAGVGLGRVSVHTETGEEFVEVSVADDGPGLPSDDEFNVFDPFVTTKSDGLGLGLAISKSIVEAHGGRLWATSKAERGTVFHFTLPVDPRTPR